MTPVRETRMWAIVGPRGKVYHVASSKFMAWATIYNPRTYVERDERRRLMEARGFRAVPVTIQEARHDER